MRVQPPRRVGLRIRRARQHPRRLRRLHSARAAAKLRPARRHSLCVFAILLIALGRRWIRACATLGRGTCCMPLACSGMKPQAACDFSKTRGERKECEICISIARTRSRRMDADANDAKVKSRWVD